MPETRVTIANGAVTLEGMLHTPAQGTAPFPGVVVCHPHPMYGGDMGNNVVMAVVAGLTAHGVAALRFNFRGVGQSTGAYDSGKGEQSDVMAALECLYGRREIDPSRVGLAGYSFGAGMAVAAAHRDQRLRAVAAVSPPGPASNAPAFLAWPRPKLILTGDMDSFVPVEEVHQLARHVKTPLQIEVLNGADHFHAGYESQIAQRVGAFFSSALT